MPTDLETNLQPEPGQSVISEAETDAKAADRIAQATAVRAKAARFMAEGRYADARKALEEADAIEAKRDGVFASLRSRLGDNLSPKKEEVPGLGAVDSSVKTVNLYSGIAAVAGLLPGGLLNFAGVLAVEVIMVWRIAKHFGHTADRGQIRGAIVALIGSAIPMAIGHTAGAAIASIPAVIAGTAVYFIATPILAWAMTQAVGKTFIMHFESGGTLLTFDPRVFGEYFLSEFEKAGGTVKRGPATAQPVPATA